MHEKPCEKRERPGRRGEAERLAGIREFRRAEQAYLEHEIRFDAARERY
jgi:hypothetical protein